MRSKGAIIILFVLQTAFVSAATTSGVLKGDETWEGVVQVTGDVIVPEGVTLTIKPNALIKFAANSDDQESGYDITKCELIIEGVLRAEGKDKYEIRFTSGSFTLPNETAKNNLQPQASDWYGIIFKRGNHDRSIVSYSVVEFAYDGITCINASPRIFRNRIEGNYWNGILCDIISSPKINNNEILNNGYAGINCKINSTPSITNNEVTGNRYGILVQDVSEPVIGDLRLGENVGRNAIYNNLEFNLYNHTKNVIYAQRNDWGDNTNADRSIHDDDENGKFGLVVYTPVYTSGKVSFVEFQTFAPIDNKAAEEEKAKREKEIEALKKKLEIKKEDKTSQSKTSGLEEKSNEEQKKILAEQQKEKERLQLLEEQARQQEQIRVEQEKQLAVQKKLEEDKKKEDAKKTEIKKEVKTEAFIPTKMANELDNNPKPVTKVNPVMPDLAKKANLSGTVSLRVLVGTGGIPEEIYVSKRIGNKDFDQMINDAAIGAVKQWTFETGLSGGQTVKYWTVVTILMK
ncbi:energy transducer TonB [bacterium]|nr:energy transducer TonB [bacterium]